MNLPTQTVLTDREVMLCFFSKFRELALHYRKLARNADMWEMEKIYRKKARRNALLARCYWRVACKST